MKSLRSSLSLVIIATAIQLNLCLDLPPTFRDYIQPTCYATDFVNGQEFPLAQTLENFVSLVEKLEDCNPTSTLSDVLGILLKNYTHENIRRGEKGGFNVYKEENYQEKYINGLWQENINKIAGNHHNPFTDEEVCCLYYMLSHTVNLTAITNNTSSDENGWSKQPRELGTVSIGRSRYSVAVGRVILGLYLGLNAVEGKTVAAVVADTEEKFIPDDFKTKKINPLPVLTFADALALANLNHEDRQLDEEEGVWIGLHSLSDLRVPPQELQSNICPTVYMLPESYRVEELYYTVPVLHGAIDGLILGSAVKEIVRTSGNQIRLSQILRMYYSSRGIKVISKPNSTPLSFCHRKELINVEEAKEQVDVFIHLSVFDVAVKEKLLQAKVFEKYIQPKTLLPTGIDVCRINNGAQPAALDVETPIDVIAVVDTSENGKQVELQQHIIGVLANSLNISRDGSSLTVLLDSDNEASGYLKELIPKTHNAACAACHAIQFRIDSTENHQENDIVIALDKMLNERKGNESSLSGAPGKVIVYFNFQEDDTDNSELRRALRNFRLRHQDSRFFAVGRNEAFLTRLAGNKVNNIIVAFGEEPRATSEQISSKISMSTARLQYLDCRNARDEANAIYEGLVSPNAIQRWEMHPKYFLKSFTPIINFEVNDGQNIKVCENRATTLTEVNEANCHSTNSSAHKLSFQYPNPCQGFNENNCSPFYFTVIGLPESVNGDERPQLADQYCRDADNIKCKTLDQIQFKITHEGVRCSGAASLLSSFNVTLLLICFALFYNYNPRTVDIL